MSKLSIQWRRTLPLRIKSIYLSKPVTPPLAPPAVPVEVIGKDELDPDGEIAADPPITVCHLPLAQQRKANVERGV